MDKAFAGRRTHDHKHDPRAHVPAVGNRDAPGKLDSVLQRVPPLSDAATDALRTELLSQDAARKHQGKFL
jgi:hypothetical protein